MSDTMYINDKGSETILSAQLGVSSSLFANGKLRLFQNNVLCSDSTLLSAFVEANFPGYAAITWASGDWNAITITAHVANTTPVSAFAFECTGGGSSQNIYGWYLTDSTGAYLLACCTFAAGPYPVVNNGDAVNCEPTMTGQSVN